jgi:hypothetical protein
VRKTRSQGDALYWLYLRGISTGEKRGVPKVLFGYNALGLLLIINFKY